jgi:hypothetical protein
MSISDEHVLACIKRWAWSGFYSTEDINRMTFSMRVATKRPCAERSISELAMKIAAEIAWPAVTDCDKLDAVFYRLHERGICAL